MSKKTPVKKTNRKLKRSIRRSIAAVLMITAIGIAAVPVPENYAEGDPSSSGGSNSTTIVEPTAYKYPSSPNKICQESYKPASDATIYSAKIITPLSDGSYQLDWQFKFFLKNVSGSQKGIICQYNSTYQQDTVVLNPNVIYEYESITEENYDKWYEGDGTNPGKNVVEYKVDGSPDSTNKNDIFLSEYFSEAYQKYVADYADYEKKLEQYIRDGSVGTAPSAPELIKTVGELSVDQKLKYYCEQNSMPDYKLAKVIDSEHSVGVNKIVYIPKGNVSEETDDQGFLVVNKSSIIGIGDEAFKGTKNVYYLTVPKEIKFIGISAFQDSFIKEIAFYNVEHISDYAFKNCSQLTKVNMGEGTTLIGTEAFYGAGLTSVEFPQSIEEIGPGAFAYCESLQKIDLSKITTSPAKIDEYAFYNAIALNEVNVMKASSPNVTVNIDTIGDGAFAVYSGVVGSMTSFTFPSKISKVYSGGTGLGDCVLAGRTNLQTVVMPADFGRSTGAVVPANTFFNCYNLACVEFPDDGSGSCGLASYNADKLFASVNNADFYVKGPELDRTKSIATPRRTTWEAKTAVAPLNEAGDKKANVPYLYIKNGLEYYEVSDGDYLLSIDNKGVLTSCTPVDPDRSDPIDLVIPEKVGNTKVTAIASGCFSNDAMNQRVRTLTIEDNSISIISDGVFKNWKKLQQVYIGNSVTSIGSSAFEGCESLIDVTFNTPVNGHDSFVIGTDAFKTVGPELTFHGDIVEGYAPFEWAMDKDNLINATDGIRVCYKSLTPTYLTVMYDANTELVTLLDYPKYDQISKVLKDAHSIEIASGGYTSYEKMMEDKYYQMYKASEYDSYRKAFAETWKSALENTEDVEAAKKAAYESNDYGPWVNAAFCADWQSVLTASNETEEQTILTALADMLFEPLVVEAADNPAPFYTTYPYDVVQNAESGNIYRALTEEERALLEATKNIVVPTGVESIDAYGFSNGEGSNVAKNKNNARIYLDRDRIGTDSYNMYNNKSKTDENTVTDITPGLFSGFYNDKYVSSSANYEQYKRGNDRIESVTLNSVKYLPDYAFDSCERLQYVILGPDCEDIGTAPFRGCYSLTTVGDNDYYKTDNGIVYSVNTDGSYTIEECLPARGNLVGGSQISLSTDANLGNVSAIREGAFEECKYINLVDLNDTAGLTDIPKDCFKNCSDLTRLSLPRTVNNIEEGAFVNDLKLVELTIPGTEVFISARAFEENADKAWTTVLTYENSSARRYADTYKDTYKLTYEQKQDEWRVVFLDSDLNQVGDAQYVENNTYISNVPECPAKANWTFEKWLGTNNTEVTDRITSDTTFVAQGYSDNGMVNGKYSVAFYDQVDGTQIGTTQYVEPGQAAIAPQAPVHTGYSFLKWSSEEYTNVQKNLTIMAMYSGSGTGTTSGGSTTTSGGTTTTSGSTTSGKTTSTSTSSTSNTSSSTSSSSTSATSTTAAATGQYVVTVIGGSGSGTYAQGATVQIIANTPAAGKVFSKWTTESQGVTLASVSTTPTTFVMPANNVTITAEYTDGTATPAANSVNGTATANNNTNNTGTQNGNTRVDITKPGISNKDLATANVNGSSDNFVIKISENTDVTAAVAAALTNKYGSLENILYYAMDISLYDSTGTTKLTDTTGLSVDITIPIPDALVSYGGNNMAGAVINYNPVENAQLEDLSEKFTTINGVPCVTFMATHFSPYTVYVDTGNLTEGMLDVTPKTGDPIHPKWFLSLGLACLSIILFMKKDKNVGKVKRA
ncbi:MAG: leucine-rich repeat protein [Lachnospiraceae bacterium]|nr:leucine-rich repeat protein [Lachnospiraceae bacterium]